MKQETIYQLEFIGEQVVPIQDGQSVLEASLAAGIAHFQACGGKGQCSTCRVLIKEGHHCLTPPNAKEQALMEKMHFPPAVRLACQTQVTGEPVRVHRIIRDESDLCFYIGKQAGKETQEIGEERELALLFLDIRNFTPFMESFLPFDVIHIMRRLFGIFRNAIEAHNGKIIETAGDGLYAVFGFKQSISEAAQAGVQAGKTIFRDLAFFNRSYMRVYFDHTFEIGIGLHVGNVITGNIGLGVNNNLTVMGYPVNIASRLQAATKDLNNSFIISADTYQLLLLPPNVTGTRTIPLKGISGPIQVYLIGKSYSFKSTAE